MTSGHSALRRFRICLLAWILTRSACSAEILTDIAVQSHRAVRTGMVQSPQISLFMCVLDPTVQ